MRDALWEQLDRLEKPIIWGTVFVVAAVLVRGELGVHPLDQDWDQVILNIVLLVFTGATVDMAYPRRAILQIDPHVELDRDGLVFFDHAPPRDYLIQVHIVVANVGGRQAVLSSVVLDDFLDRDGHPVRPELNSVAVPAHQYVTSVRYAETFVPGVGWNMDRTNNRDEIEPPFKLGPDDVISLRIRGRAGIDWSNRWDIARLDAVARQLERPIVKVRVVASFRRGGRLTKQRFTFPIRVSGQAAYARKLNQIVANPAMRNRIEPDPIVDY